MSVVGSLITPLSDNRDNKVGNFRLEFLPITRDVQQGSILGSLLLTIYINEGVLSLQVFNVHLQSDDTGLCCWTDSIQSDSKSLKLSFNALQCALIDLKLVLNVSKTKCVLHSRAQDINYNILKITTSNHYKESHIVNI